MQDYIVRTNDREFIVKSESSFNYVNITELSSKNSIKEYLIEVDSKENKKPLKIIWQKKMLGLLSFWSPTAGRNRSITQWFAPRTNYSNMYYGAPVISVVKQGGENFSTLALSDAVNPTKIMFSINDFEEKGNVDFAIELFCEGAPSGEYSVKLYVDESDKPFYETIPEVKRWWENFYDIKLAQTVTGEYPLYSSWYNFHQNPTQNKLLEELQIAAKLGFKSVIIDDGWSYDGLGTGDYYDCGDWKFVKSKFSDFPKFVSQVHELDMKVAVWFPVPFVGFNNPDFKIYEDKMLYLDKGFRAGIVDPRYPEIRKYIVDTYVRIVNETNIDGLKLDFIDSFKCADKSLLITDKPAGMDVDTVENAVIKLLEEIKAAVISIKNDFMIEFRQFYVGPLITSYSNMLRVADCAFDLISNRVGIIDLRLMNYDLAVHADMLLWSKEEKPEICAKMLYNIMFAVPQISIMLKKYPEQHRLLISNFINYWYNNKDVLLHGKFIVEDVENFYSYASAENNEKKIIVCYAKSDVVFDGKNIDLFNATSNDFVYVDSQSNGIVEIYDCFCDKLSNVEIKANQVAKILLPQGGMAKIYKS